MVLILNKIFANVNDLWAEFNEMLERELQKDEENRFPSWDALRIIYLFLVCVCVWGGVVSLQGEG